jgi:hypothetical protein
LMYDVIPAAIHGGKDGHNVLLQDVFVSGDSDGSYPRPEDAMPKLGNSYPALGERTNGVGHPIKTT